MSYRTIQLSPSQLSFLPNGSPFHLYRTNILGHLLISYKSASRVWILINDKYETRMTSYPMTLWYCSRSTLRAQCCAPAAGPSALSLTGNCLRWKELPPRRSPPPVAALGGLDQVFQSLVRLPPAGAALRTTPAPELSPRPRPPRRPLCRSVSLWPKSSFGSTSQGTSSEPRHQTFPTCAVWDGRLLPPGSSVTLKGHEAISLSYFQVLGTS